MDAANTALRHDAAVAQLGFSLAGQRPGGFLRWFTDFADRFSAIDSRVDPFTCAGGIDDGCARYTYRAFLPASGRAGGSLESQIPDDLL